MVSCNSLRVWLSLEFLTLYAYHFPVESLGEPGTYAGNDAIVAFARRHNVIVVIHQLNAPLWKVHGGKKGAKEIHIAYHNGDHYNSVRRIGDHSDNPANVRVSLESL